MASSILSTQKGNKSLSYCRFPFDILGTVFGPLKIQERKKTKVANNSDSSRSWYLDDVFIQDGSQLRTSSHVATPLLHWATDQHQHRHTHTPYSTNRTHAKHPSPLFLSSCEQHNVSQHLLSFLVPQVPITRLKITLKVHLQV